MTLIFATHNQNKVREIKAALGGAFTLLTLNEAGITREIPEPYDTLEANALEKARAIAALTGQACFAEDSGLEVGALNGEPGVKSARYAGEQRSDAENIAKLLRNLEGLDRGAQFRTVIAFVADGAEYLFDGICSGRILSESRGTGGFGYDPVFVPDGSDRSFGEMTLEEKNNFSHRKKAFAKLLSFLSHAQDTH
jgi:XTP/dITP diphosphohydrolase